MVIVHEVCTRRVETVDVHATARDAARRLTEHGVGGLVVTRGGRAVGMVTDGDLVRRILVAGLDPDATRVQDVMSEPVRTVAADAPLDDAVRLMQEHRVKRLLVVKDATIWGIVTVTDVAHARPELTRSFIDSWMRPRWED